MRSRVPPSRGDPAPEFENAQRTLSKTDRCAKAGDVIPALTLNPHNSFRVGTRPAVRTDSERENSEPVSPSRARDRDRQHIVAQQQAIFVQYCPRQFREKSPIAFSRIEALKISACFLYH